MLKKLRNPGGVESWFTDEEAAQFIGQVGWSVVETRSEDAEAPVAPRKDDPESPVAVAIPEQTADEESPSAPSAAASEEAQSEDAPAKKRKGR